MLLHRHLPFIPVHAALYAVERIGSVHPALVAIEGASQTAAARPPSWSGWRSGWERYSDLAPPGAVLIL